jgi:hypothetical protein
MEEFTEYRRLILSELKRLDERVDKISERIHTLSMQLTEEKGAFPSDVNTVIEDTIKDIKKSIFYAKRDLTDLKLEFTKLKAKMVLIGTVAGIVLSALVSYLVKVL